MFKPIDTRRHELDVVVRMFGGAPFTIEGEGMLKETTIDDAFAGQTFDISNTRKRFTVRSRRRMIWRKR